MSTQNENQVSKKLTKQQANLMKKTKKELVEIVISQDNVENELRKSFNNVSLDLDKAKNMISNCENRIKEVEKEKDEYENEVQELRNTMDDFTAIHANEMQKNITLKRWNVILIVLCVILGAVAIVF